MAVDKKNPFIATSEKVMQVANRLQKNIKNCTKEEYLKHCVSCLKQICTAAVKPEGEHFQIYCNIIENFVPHIEPQISAKYWSMFLYYVRYLQSLMIQKKFYQESKIIYMLISKQSDKFQTENDLKYVLTIYLQHLFTLSTAIKNKVATAETEATNILNGLTDCFDKVLRLGKSFTTETLITDFEQLLFPSKKAFAFISMLPKAETSKMFEAFFRLLNARYLDPQSKESEWLQAEKHVSALNLFFLFDVINELQLQVALQHLRVLKQSRTQTEICDGFSLLYYFIKLIYLQGYTNNFSRYYTEVCKKFKEKCGEVFAKEQKWFKDIIIFLQTVIKHLEQAAFSKSSSMFQYFWKQMNTNEECYLAHFALIETCANLTPYITASDLQNWNCCSSPSKHLMITLMQSMMSAYHTHAINFSNAEVLTETGKKPQICDKLNDILKDILKRGLSIVKEMPCIINRTVQDAYNIYARLSEISRAIKTATHARFFATTLADIFLNQLRHILTSEEWSLLLRRTLVAVEKLKQAELSAELSSCYIASLLNGKTDPPISAIRSEVNFYYSSRTSQTSSCRKTCILKVYHSSSRKWKSDLNLQQRRFLLWIETQYVSTYERSNTELKKSLLEFCDTIHDYIFVRRCINLTNSPDDASIEKVKIICNKLKQKVKSGERLKRSEQLTLGHAYGMIFQTDLNMKTNKFKLSSKECSERQLLQLLHNKELNGINVEAEWKFLKTAVDAFEAFQTFFAEMDNEYVSSDVAWIDMELILEDISMLATYFQFSGYINYANSSWLLYYKVANMVDDTQNTLRALAYFCEYFECFADNSIINLDEEIKAKLPILVEFLKNLSEIGKRVQNYILLCLCHLAYYYFHQGNYQYAKLLMKLVEEKHESLPDRTGKVDIVIVTLELVKIRTMLKDTNQVLSTHCRLRLIEASIKKFRNFTCLTMGDSSKYSIILFSTIQIITECTTNRLVENFVEIFFSSALKMALVNAAALRTIQILVCWMCTNLKEERIDRAKIKLCLIEYFMNLTTNEDISKMNKKDGNLKGGIMAVTPHLGKEILRRVADRSASPIIHKKSEEINWNHTSLNNLLDLYQKNEHNKEGNEIIRSLFLILACLIARLTFLSDISMDLNVIYKKLIQQLQICRGLWIFKNLGNFDYLSMKHYIYYLRSKGRLEEAYDYIELALDGLDKNSSICYDVDNIYQIFFKQQKNIILSEKLMMKAPKAVEIEPKRIPIRRALEFNVIPEVIITSNAIKASPSHPPSAPSDTPLPLPIEKKIKSNEEILNLCSTSTFSEKDRTTPPVANFGDDSVMINYLNNLVEAKVNKLTITEGGTKRITRKKTVKKQCHR